MYRLIKKEVTRIMRQIYIVYQREIEFAILIDDLSQFVRREA